MATSTSSAPPVAPFDTVTNHPFPAGAGAADAALLSRVEQILSDRCEALRCSNAKLQHSPLEPLAAIWQKVANEHILVIVTVVTAPVS